MTSHLIIPDTQVKKGVPLDHLDWIGQYILDKRPDEVIHLGDHWDMPSLSSYDRKGGTKMEGRRYMEDVEAGNEGMARLDKALNRENRRLAKNKKKLWTPRKRLLRGNHEYRIMRAVEADAQLEGVIGYHHLEAPGWEVYDFLLPVEIDGVVYCHYFQNRGTGKPLGGLASTRLKTLGHTFVQGHQQVLDVTVRYVLKKQQWGIVAGAAYLHHEDYLGYQGNMHWRGIIMLNNVEDGAFTPWFVDLDYLCRRYEGKSLEKFLTLKKYR